MPTRRPSKRRRSRPEVLARRAERRSYFLDAADQVIRRDGPGASINQIAAEARIAKPVLYRHFGDKGGLYQALAERYVRILLDDLRASLEKESTGRALLASTIDSYLRFVDENRPVYRFLMHRAVSERPEAQETVTDFMRQVAGEVAVVLGEELRRNGLDSGGAEPWAHGIVGMVELAADWWLRTQSMPRERLAVYLTDLLWNGFEGMARKAGSSLPAESAS
jgi:AcrR family transcriptional regulator